MLKFARSDPARPIPSRTGGFVLGRANFAQISAVEGIALTPDMREIMNGFDRDGLSAAERRRAILKRFAPMR